MQGQAGQGGGDPERGGADEGADDAAFEHQQPDGGEGQDGLLPGVGDAAGEEDGRAEMAPIAAGPAPARNARTAAVAAEAVEAPAAAEQTKTNDGVNATTAASSAAGDAGGGVADDRDGLHDGAGGDLAEGDRVEELVAGHPVIVADRVGLHQRDDDEAAAVRQRARP